MDSMVHGVAKSWTGLSDFHFTSGMNLIKKVKYTLKTIMKLIKDIEGDSNKQKCHVVGLEELVKMAILPKAIYRFNAVNVLMTFSTELEQVILKLT